ncbi:MAG: hypothetical protein ACKO3R_04450 [bacterium]
MQSIGTYPTSIPPIVNITSVSPLSPLGSRHTFPTPSALSQPLTPITKPEKINHLQAIIKIGSNTGSLTITDLVNNYTESDKFNLGEDLSGEGKKELKPENIEYSLKTMERWAQIMKLYGIAECQIVATKSLRAASDGQTYLDKAKKILNDANRSMVINDRIILPQEEAELSIKTVKSQLGPKIEDGYVVDYGGASCEISEVLNNELATGGNGKGVFSSLKIGTHPLIAELKKIK